MLTLDEVLVGPKAGSSIEEQKKEYRFREGLLFDWL